MDIQMSIVGIEGLLVSIALLLLPFLILFVLIKLLPPWNEARHDFVAPDGTAAANPS